MTNSVPPPSRSAAEALDMLRKGNRRFMDGDRSMHIPMGHEARAALVAGQKPFATILACADSRVPAELVFDQGLGDLFVVRVAGNVVAPSLVGSVEFASATFGTRLVVVMGHSQCGAIKATLDVVQHKAGVPTDNLRDIVERCRAPVQTVVHCSPPDTAQNVLLEKAVRANVRNSVDHLRHGSALLERLGREAGLMIVGAEYSLETGEIDFFYGADDLKQSA